MTPVLTNLPTTTLHSKYQLTIVPLHKIKATKPPIPGPKGKRARIINPTQVLDLIEEDHVMQISTEMSIAKEPDNSTQNPSTLLQHKPPSS